MFLRTNKRFKDGKEHRYWSLVETRRTQAGHVVQRQVLYLGVINESQRAAWCRTIAVFNQAAGHADILSMLLENGVDINQQYANNLTVLMWSTGYGQLAKRMCQRLSRYAQA